MNMHAETEHFLELPTGEEFGVLIAWDAMNQECSSYYGSQLVTEKWVESEPVSGKITFDTGKSETFEFGPHYKPETEAQKLLEDAFYTGLIEFDESLLRDCY